MPVVVERSPGAISETKRLVGPLATTLIVVVFIVFMLSKREDLRNRLLRLAGQGRLNITTQALDEATGRIGRIRNHFNPMCPDCSILF
jgi:predicted PurR-regulated permease PerM